VFIYLEFIRQIKSIHEELLRIDLVGNISE
jgi:hypothetical protein